MRVDDERARSSLPFRSAERFLAWLARPDQLDARLPELVAAINRGEGLPDPALAGELGLAVRHHQDRDAVTGHLA
jgi:hypothetical protein